jgi:hypothetical protein
LVELETINLLVQIVGVSAAAIATVVGVRSYIVSNKRAEEARKRELETRQAQLFMPIYSTYYSDDFIRARSEIMKWKWDEFNDYMAKYSYEANPDAYIMYRKVFGYFEGLGVLVRRGLIDPSLVDDLMSGAIVSYWEKFRSFVLEYRERMDWPQVGEQIEYLYNEIKPIVEKQRRELKDSP